MAIINATIFIFEENYCVQMDRRASGAREAFRCAWRCGRIFLRFFGKAYSGRVKGRENGRNRGFDLVLRDGIKEAKPVPDRKKCLFGPERKPTIID